MIPDGFDPSLLTRRDDFADLIVTRLGNRPCDFPSAYERVRQGRNGQDRQRAAGVLLPLLFREQVPGQGRYVFQLIKRSPWVPQPGDLSLPGGMLQPADHLFRFLAACRLCSPSSRRALHYARRQADPSLRLITLFLANALRESREEIGLRPSRIRFLGPLPSYSLTLFRRTIFPLVGFVEQAVPLHLNREVAKVVEIPLADCFRDDLYGGLQIALPDPAGGPAVEYPCLVFRDGDSEEVLWGATFHILTGFLGIVSGFSLPDWKSGRRVRRILNADYLTGRSEKSSPLTGKRD
jgi:8-oxo-dGTP pyrophosphatase MutT (NUDIX family)